MSKKLHNVFIIALTILGYCLVIILFQVVIRGHISPEKLAEESPEKHSVHWSYGGSGNPTRWGQLSENYRLCETGTSQSPIDISTKHPTHIQIQEEFKPIQFNYQLINFTVKNNGHTIQVDYPPGSYIILDGKKYNLVQFHFHTPSEHLVNEVAWPMEMHLVHQNAEGQLAVVGVLIEEGEENYFLQQIWDHLPEAEGEEEVKRVKINAENLLPENRSYYSYSGSLTTPPCSEEVSWNVLKIPIKASEEQIEQFMEIYQMNSRPVQPLNRRKIELNQ